MGSTMSELLEDPPSEFEVRAKIQGHRRTLQLQRIRFERDGNEHMMLMCDGQLDQLGRMERDLTSTSNHLKMSEVEDTVNRYLKDSTRQLEERLVEQAGVRRDVLPKVDFLSQMAMDVEHEYQDREEEQLEARLQDDRYQERLQLLRAKQLPVAPSALHGDTNRNPQPLAFTSL